jgi:hypothetical protein
MTTSLKPGNSGIIVRIAIPSLTAGMLSHARKAARARSHRSFAVIKHVIAVDHAMAQSVHHHHFCLWLSRNGRRIHCWAASARLECP